MKFKKFNKCIAILTAIVIFTTTAGASIVPGVYFVFNENSRKVLAAITNDNGSSNIDAGVTQWDFNGQPGQRWNVNKGSNGLYTLTPLSNTNSRLHLTGNANVNGATVQTYSSAYPQYQQWHILRNRNGSYRLVPSVSYTRSMNVRGSVHTNGAGIEIWDEIGSKSQQWWFVPTRASNGLITKTARIRYDSATTPSDIVSGMSDVFYTATSAFVNNFGIQFTLSSTAQDSALSKSPCLRPIYQECSSIAGCAPNVSCNILHHKGASRLKSFLQHSTIYTIRVVGYTLCHYNAEYNDHYKPGGLGDRPGRDTIVTTAYSASTEHLMQHELSHNLGATHCYSDGCIMGNNPKMDTWCDTCKAAIWNNR